MIDNEKLMEVVRAILEAGLAKNATEIGRRINVGYHYFTDIRSGRTNPTPEVLERLADAYHVSRDFLNSGNGHIFVDRETKDDIINHLRNEVERLNMELYDLKRRYNELLNRTAE